MVIPATRRVGPSRYFAKRSTITSATSSIAEQIGPSHRIRQHEGARLRVTITAVSRVLGSTVLVLAVTACGGTTPVAGEARPAAFGDRADAGATAVAPADRAPTRATAVVVNTGSDSVSVVDLERMREVSRHTVGNKPYGVAVSRDGKRVAVGVEGEERVAFFSYPGFTPEGEAAIGPMHHDHVLLGPDGATVLVANYESDSVIGIDMAAMTETFRVAGASGAHAAKLGPASGHVYVTCKKVTGVAQVDPVARELVRFRPLKVNPRGLSFFPSEARAYFGSFWVDGFFELDMKSGEVARLIQLAPPQGSQPREVTYHGVEAVLSDTVIAANEGRSYLDVVNVVSGEHLHRFRDVAKTLLPRHGAGPRAAAGSRSGEQHGRCQRAARRAPRGQRAGFNGKGQRRCRAQTGRLRSEAMTDWARALSPHLAPALRNDSRCSP